MKPARLVVLGIALGSAALAAILMTRTATPPAPIVMEQAAAPVRTSDVLVAAGDLPVGQTLKPGDIKWVPWPSNYVPANAIVRGDSPGAAEELTGSIVRQSAVGGEPIRREKLVKADGSGFMSAILSPGMRALAISIDMRGATSAGGFILPNDHVDVLRTYKDDSDPQQQVETVLANVRVLAIGQNVQDRGGEKVVSGETATLEVTPGQAEALALAQRSGQLALTLRSLADARPDSPRDDRSDTGLQVIRYGVARQAKR